MARFSLRGVVADGSSEGAGPSQRRSKRLRPSEGDPIVIGGCPPSEGNPLGVGQQPPSEADPLGVSARNEAEESEEEDEEEESEDEEEEDDDDDEEEEEEEEEEEGDGGEREEVVGSQSNGSTVTLPDTNNVGPVSATLTDLDVLDCPVCYDSLKPPVFQCDSGHIACSSCCNKLQNKCPFCCWSIGYIRCRAIEKVLESVKISCQNSQYGCKEKVSYGKKDDHEERCLYAPCSCPLPACNFLGSFQQLTKHLSSKHSTSTKKFRYNCLFTSSLGQIDKFLVFQEESESSLFILNNTIERLGNAVTVSCIGPRPRRGFSYDLIAKNEGSSLRLQSVIESTSGQVKNPSTGFLIVPTDFFSSRQLKLDLCIRTNCASPAGS